MCVCICSINPAFPHLLAIPHLLMGHPREIMAVTAPSVDPAPTGWWRHRHQRPWPSWSPGAKTTEISWEIRGGYQGHAWQFDPSIWSRNTWGCILGVCKYILYVYIYIYLYIYVYIYIHHIWEIGDPRQPCLMPPEASKALRTLRRCSRALRRCWRAERLSPDWAVSWAEWEVTSVEKSAIL